MSTVCLCTARRHPHILTIYVIFSSSLFFTFYLFSLLLLFVLYFLFLRRERNSKAARSAYTVCKLGYAYMFGLSTKTINRNLCVVVVLVVLFTFFSSLANFHLPLFLVCEKWLYCIWYVCVRALCAHTHSKCSRCTLSLISPMCFFSTSLRFASSIFCSAVCFVVCNSSFLVCLSMIFVDALYSWLCTYSFFFS